jgi:hypothetical protein
MPFSTMGMDAAPRLRVGLVSARFTLFDAQMPAEFPRRMRDRVASCVTWLSERFEVVPPTLL